MLYLNNADTANADPYADVRQMLDWYEGLWVWGEAWRDEARRLQREQKE